MAKQSLNVPPFPVLHWDEYLWAGEVVLPSWAGFQSRRGPYASVNSRAASDGSAALMVMPEDGDARTPPLVEQARAFQLLLDNFDCIGCGGRFPETGAWIGAKAPAEMQVTWQDLAASPWRWVAAKTRQGAP